MARQGTSAKRLYMVSSKLAVSGDTGAGGLVAPLPCTAYFGKLATVYCLAVPCHGKRRPSPFVLDLYHSLASLVTYLAS